jgi:beta-N-acetylhexosaminidase
MNRILILTGLVMLMAVVFFSGCGDANHGNGQPDNADAWAEKTLAGLTLEKKVAQLICTDISGDYLPEDDPKFRSWVELARDEGIGGFVLYGGTPCNVARLLNRLQREAAIPILISADFEGGAGQQIDGASEFPGNLGFAATGDEQLMYEAARIMAAEGRAMGIHLTYTPVCDVSVDPDNPQESVRSFGGDLDLIGSLLKAYVRGFSEMGMLTTAKHFPGRGDMKSMPGYNGFNYLDRSREELMDNEFRAFKSAIDAGVNFVMTEHIAIPSITGGSELPASVEPKLIRGVLRKQLGFEGIVTTDDLWYDHVTERFGAEEVAVLALQAGHDVLLKPRDPVATIHCIVNAVRGGRLSESRIDSSVYRLLRLKAMLGLHRDRFVDMERIGNAVGTADHMAKTEEVADRSLTLLKNDGVLPVDVPANEDIVHITVQKTALQPTVEVLKNKMTGAFEGIRNYSLGPGSCDTDYAEVEHAISTARLVILSFFVQRDRFGDAAPLRDRDVALVNRIIDEKPHAVIAMSYGNPHIIRKIVRIPAYLTGYGEGGWYGNQEVYFDSFIRLMKGDVSPVGKLPLEVGDVYQIGTGFGY